MGKIEKRKNKIAHWSEQFLTNKDAIGYNSRIFVLCNLPYRDPGNVEIWTKTHGNASLSIQPLTKIIEGEKFKYGFPYGSIPRLIIYYLITQSMITKKREIILGHHISEFMSALKLNVQTNNRRRLKNQMLRLFNCAIQFCYGEKQVIKNENIAFVRDYTLWWNEDKYNKDCPDLFESYVTLDLEFFEEIQNHSFPLKIESIAKLKKSPLALDLYSWATYRNHTLKKKIFISWDDLYSQFGSEYNAKDNFVKSAKAELKKVKDVWPELNIEEIRGGMYFAPSRSQISVTKIVNPDFTTDAIPGRTQIKKLTNINKNTVLYKTFIEAGGDEEYYINAIQQATGLYISEEQLLKSVSDKWKNSDIFFQRCAALMGYSRFSEALHDIISKIKTRKNTKTDPMRRIRDYLLRELKEFVKEMSSKGS